jgi:exodeoxyribonuclease VII small subunit
MSTPASTSRSFEQSLVELEQTVRKLEDGQLGLEQALESYEQGIGLLKHCYGLLERAEKRIQVLRGLDANGQPITGELDTPA